MELALGASESKTRPQPHRIAMFLLALTMFMTGAAGFVYECILSTVSTFILGNSIEQWSVIMALMLCSMGIAGFLQKFISDNKLVEKFILAELLLATIGGFAPIALYAAHAMMEDHFLLVLYSLAAMIGGLIGIEIPLAMRINERYAKSLGVNIATIWAADYVGSFIGALIWTFWLLRTFPLTQVSFMIAACNLVVAAVMFVYFAKQRLIAYVLPLTVAVAVAAGSVWFGYRNNIVWANGLLQQLYDAPITVQQLTKYQLIVGTLDKSTNDFRLYLNGNLQFSSVDENRYHESLVIPALSLAPSRKRVLVLGGGDGLAMREILKFKDVETVTLVDLDPEMIRLASTNKILTKMNKGSFLDARVHKAASKGINASGETRALSFRTGEKRMVKGKLRPVREEVGRVEIFTVDADKFIEQPHTPWDVVIIDLPDPNSPELAKLYSKEFYLKVKRSLAWNGVVVIQSTSPFHAKEAYLCVGRTMEAAGLATMPYHVNVPSFGEWGYYLAWNNKVPESVLQAKIGHLTSFPVQTSWLTPDVFRSQLVFGRSDLEPEFTEVSTLFRPVILEYYVHHGWKIE